MLIDEAIKHCEDVAEQSEYSAIMFRQKKEGRLKNEMGIDSYLIPCGCIYHKNSYNNT